jgi:cation transport ATPase
MQKQRITLPIYNLSCGGGSALTVERILAQQPGVLHVYVNPATEMAYVEYDPVLSDVTQLNAALERTGFRPITVKTQDELATREQALHTLDTRRLAVAAGLVLMAFYALCIIAGLLFPNLFQMYRFWELILIGFQRATSWTLLLGLVEAFLYGALGGWAFAALYNMLPAGTARQHSRH